MRYTLFSMIMLAFMCAAAAGAFGQTFYDESIDGDLSDSGAAPTPAGILITGDNYVQGSVGVSGDNYDSFTFEVPAGFILQNVLLTAYSPQSPSEFTSLAMTRGTSDAGEQVEFILMSPGSIGTDLLQFDSAPGPQGPGFYTITWGYENGAVDSWGIDLILAPRPADLFWNETYDGDLSDSGAAPTPAGILITGDNYVQGSVGVSGDNYDSFTFEVPAGFILQNVLLTAYSPQSPSEFTSLAMTRGTSDAGEQVEFILMSPGSIGTDLLQFDSAPGPQGPGFYTITWGYENGAVDSWGIDLVLLKSVSPGITSILDVGNDQGRQVRIQFVASSRDSAGSETPIVRYDVYRRVDDLKSATDRSGMLEKASGIWDMVGLTYAHGDPQYSLVVPTLADSTVQGGVYYSAFFVRASTADPYAFFDSPPDSGYSLDNLAPAVPAGAALGGAQVLTWDDPPEPDFKYFTVYGSESGLMDGTEVVIGYTTGTAFDAAADPYSYFLLTATDFAGNESGPAVLVNTVSGAEPPSAERTALLGNHPNPFNPMTVITYDLADSRRVSLTVFDMAGRTVRRLLDGVVQPAGRQMTPWRGLDDTGRQAASGTYFYRLEAGDYSETKRMVLVK